MADVIMVVEDEDNIRANVAEFLQTEGYETVLAKDGEEALRLFEAAPPDLVILDLMLPKVDGLEVCKRLRGHSAVPIIMVTARNEEIDKLLGLELGADDYITKPFSLRELRPASRLSCAGPRSIPHRLRPKKSLPSASWRLNLDRRRSPSRRQSRRPDPFRICDPHHPFAKISAVPTAVCSCSMLLWARATLVMNALSIPT